MTTPWDLALTQAQLYRNIGGLDGAFVRHGPGSVDIMLRIGGGIGAVTMPEALGERLCARIGRTMVGQVVAVPAGYYIWLVRLIDGFDSGGLDVVLAGLDVEILADRAEIALPNYVDSEVIGGRWWVGGPPPDSYRMSIAEFVIHLRACGQAR